MSGWPMRREAWKTHVTTGGGVVCSRQLLSVELWPALLGWWVIARYGPATAYRWRWSGRKATVLFDESVLVAEEFATSWPDAERRSVLPLGVRGLR